MPMKQLPNLVDELIQPVDIEQLIPQTRSQHPPRILVLYGSLRERSYSRLAGEEAARILERLGAEVRIYNPSGLPLVDDGVDADHPKVAELHEIVAWCEGMVWSSPERHGAMTGIMKTQIDWIPLSLGSVRPTQGKTLAVMQVNGGSQSFNTVNQLRILGRWMRLLTVPNQSSVARAWDEFDEDGRMKPSAYYNRIVDVMEELVRFTVLTRDIKDMLVDRYSERVESHAELSAAREHTNKLVDIEAGPRSLHAESDRDIAAGDSGDAGKPQPVKARLDMRRVRMGQMDGVEIYIGFGEAGDRVHAFGPFNQ
jgi:arsenic resistance protein ArsH